MFQYVKHFTVKSCFSAGAVILDMFSLKLTQGVWMRMNEFRNPLVRKTICSVSPLQDLYPSPHPRIVNVTLLLEGCNDSPRMTMRYLTSLTFLMCGEEPDSNSDIWRWHFVKIYVWLGALTLYNAELQNERFAMNNWGFSFAFPICVSE